MRYELLAYLTVRKEHGDYHADIMHDWIKSIEDKVQPLQKVEWNDKDEEKINTLCVYLNQMLSFNMISNENVTENINWLKSLSPQKQWKPSEEQMKALKEVTDKQWDVDGDALWHLYEDLKKLKE